MKEALAQAEIALSHAQVPIGCVIVRGNNVIARAANATSISPIHHAEMIAMADIDVRKEFQLYVTVEPCIMCISALMQTACSRIVYGAKNDKFGGCGGVIRVAPQSPWREIEIVDNVLRDSAVLLLQKFFAIPNQNTLKV